MCWNVCVCFVFGQHRWKSSFVPPSIHVLPYPDNSRHHLKRGLIRCPLSIVNHCIQCQYWGSNAVMKGEVAPSSKWMRLSPIVSNIIYTLLNLSCSATFGTLDASPRVTIRLLLAISWFRIRYCKVLWSWVSH